MNKLGRILFVFGLICVFMIPNFCFADVGNFESYDYDYDYDYGGSWSSGYDYSYGSSDLGGFIVPILMSGEGGIGFIILLIIIGIIISNSRKSGANNYSYNNHVRPQSYNFNQDSYIRNSARSERVADNIREMDKYFNDEKFITWVKNLFVKLQTAWSDRDWETIRPLESEALFEQHSRQLEEYISRKQINKIERICVNFAELVSFSNDNEKDILIVALNASMIDYIIDEQSGKLLQGDKNRRLTNTYKLTFIRKNGFQTTEGTGEKKTTNCPNCGAPTEITSSGKCEYCNSVITIGEHDWVLNDMERYK